MPRTPIQGMAFLLGFAIALWLSPFGAGTASGEETAPHWNEAETRLFAAVNAERERMHLVPLARDTQLDAVARAHSADMASHGYLSHVNLAGRNPLVTRTCAAGAPWA